MLTILTWLWRQPGSVYTAHHVNTWAAMVRRNVTLRHRLACVTDMPDGIDPRIDIIPLPSDFSGVTIPSWGPDRPQCFRRLAMFRRDAAKTFGARFVSMDLDCVIAGNIDHLFRRPDDIVLYASPPGSPGKRPYNGSLLLLAAGARPQVYEQFTPEGAAAAGKRYVGSDQAWISRILGPGEATWGEDHGVYWRGRWKRDVDAKVIFFIGAVKPWDQMHDSRVRQHYRLEEGNQ